MQDPIALIAAARARREAAGLIADDGAACATQEALTFRNALLAWHKAGRPAAERAHLETLEAAATASLRKGA